MIIGELPFKDVRLKGDYNAPKSSRGIPVEVDIHHHFVAQAHGFWPFKKIMLGASWFNLDSAEKQAVLLHEVGHCKRFHMEKRLLFFPLLLFDFDKVERMAREQEHEADEFAARAGYGLELLSAIKKIPPHDTEWNFYPTYEEREKRIKSHG